jgi:hypothetical protein
MMDRRGRCLSRRQFVVGASRVPQPSQNLAVARLSR